MAESEPEEPRVVDVTDEPDAREPDELDDEDFEDSDDDDSDDVNLGFAREPGSSVLMMRNHFPSKLGGLPAWLDPVQLPVEAHQLKCGVSGERMNFLLQLYAPVDEANEAAFHRTLYLFISPKGHRLHERGTVRAFRSQLPRQNEHHLFEPPLDDDAPARLSDSAAATARRRCPSFAAIDEASPAWAGSARKKVCAYKEHELVVETEPEAAEGTVSTDEVTRLLDDFKKKEAEAADVLGKGGNGEDTEKDLSAFGPRDAAVDGYADFTARVSRAPAQCIRYTYAQDASPLWTGRQHTLANDAVPRCERCGARRRFEFQVMPQAITFLGVDSALEDAPDWGTIAVYTCSASCSPLEGWPGHGCLEDPTPTSTAKSDEPGGGGGRSDEAGGAASAAAHAGVGVRCVLEGLASRADLNGRSCEVLYWHVHSGRWAVEIEGGERLRVRSSNLRVARPESATGCEREGGYAEEFVWVQPH